RAVGEEVPAPVVERLGAMTRALGVLGRPDGTLHLFNDAAQGIAPPAGRLGRLARLALGIETAAPSGMLELRESGFLGWVDAGAGERLVIDCGAPSPAYQPGHAHCGALGFELDLLGRPALVDSGCHGYEGDPFREYVRSTRAHNTVAVGGREQSEVWGTFRVGRRAKVLEAAHSVGDGRYRFSGALRPFDGRGVHRRTIERGADGWRVEDRVDGAAGERVTAWLHFHPDWSVETRDGGAVARCSGGEIAIDVFGADEVRVIRGERSPVQGWYCPEFGRALPAAALELTVRANDSRAFGCVLHSTEVLSPES
ncbi:MAG TPA: heparinase II/III-family protein, partial [Longimicrobium sp.]|nr:heparinase II/III-family protein [Longimicrobium sp.]